MYSKLAEELKLAREKSQLSPEFIAQKIKIDLKFLRMMEKGDFTFLPEIYIKAFLKEYARLVGLDENQTLKKYELAKEGKDFSEEVLSEEIVKETKKQVTTETVKTNIVEDYDKSREEEPEHSKNNRKSVLMAFSSGAVILTLFLVYIVFFYESTDKIITEKPYEEIIRESKKRFEEEPQKTDNSRNDSDSLFLAFKAFDSSWLQVVFDGNETKEYYLYPKNSLEITAGESFNLTIGNSYGVDVFLNGEKIDVKGKTSAVSRVIIDREGIKPINIKTSVTKPVE